MISNTINMGEQRINKSIINSMLQVLNDSLKSDQTLANDLFHFLQERNISIPNLSKQEIDKILPVSFSNKNSDGQMDRLKNSFEENDLRENIL